jgi:two-component system, sensor histidine kinase PdtaS
MLNIKIPLFFIDSDYHNFYEKARMKITWRLNLILLIFLPILMLTLYQSGESAATPTLFGFLLCLFLFFWMKKTNTYKFSAIAHSLFGAFLCVFVLIFFPESYHFVDIAWMLVIILHTYFTLGRKWGTAVLIFSIVSTLYYLFFMLNISLDLNRQLDKNQVIALAINFSICMLVIAYYIRQFLKVNAFAENKYIELTSALEDKNKEKTVLLKEIHHRVKNNLQVITSLLRLQSKEITEEKYLKLYEESINRVVAMAMIHDKIFKNPDVAKIDLEDYIQSLVKDLIRSYSLSTEVEVEIKSYINEVGAKSLVPIALIFNELITNSLKHAYRNMDKGKICINISKVNDQIELNYSDNGEWDENTSPNSLGLDLIDSLTKQLNGTCDRKVLEKGTSFNFFFQEEDLN